jgi:uncharacterized membrane protein
MPTPDAPPAALQTGETPGAPSPGRLPVVDLARGIAIVAMAAYHFSWDLETFGGVWLDMQDALFWQLARYLIAGSFLFLVGVGLVLATRRGFDWARLSGRIARIALGAVAVTVATFLVMRQGFIFFGILHAIALFSLIGLAAVRLPAWTNAGLGAAIILLSFLPGAPLFDAPALLWVGLGTVPPLTNDYEPIFPWLGPVLIGIAAGRLWLAAGAPGGGFDGGVLGRGLRWAGRHALPVYLLHQPILWGAVVGWTAAFGHAPVSEVDLQLCKQESQRQVGWDDATADSYCSCIFARIVADPEFPTLDEAGQRARAQSFVPGCFPAPSGRESGG